MTSEQTLPGACIFVLLHCCLLIGYINEYSQISDFQSHQWKSQSQQKCRAEENQRKGREKEETRETKAQSTIQVRLIVNNMVFSFRKLNVSLHLIIGSQTAFCVTWLMSDCMHVMLTFPNSFWMKEISVLYNQVLQCLVLEDSALCSQTDMVLLSAISGVVCLYAFSTCPVGRAGFLEIFILTVMSQMCSFLWFTHQSLNLLLCVLQLQSLNILAFSTYTFHLLQSWMRLVQFFIFSFFISFLISSFHLFFCLPSGHVNISFHLYSFFTILSSGIHSKGPNQLNLCAFM